jgi:hypothetical protein
MPYRMNITRLRAALLGLSLLTGSAPLWPAAADIAVSRQDCDRLVKYHQPPGVDYQPGVDAHGETVVPADLNPSNIRVPDVIEIEVEIFLQDRFHIPTSSPLWAGKVEAGTVTVEGDEVYFNHQLLTEQDDQALAAICREQLPYK